MPYPVRGVARIKRPSPPVFPLDARAVPAYSLATVVPRPEGEAIAGRHLELQ
jgi:hypothetical protein